MVMMAIGAVRDRYGKVMSAIITTYQAEQVSTQSRHTQHDGRTQTIITIADRTDESIDQSQLHQHTRTRRGTNNLHKEVQS